jgi:hypothetical protein
MDLDAMRVALGLVIIAVLLIQFACNEVRIYRRGGDVYEWTKKLDSILRKYNV